MIRRAAQRRPAVIALGVLLSMFTPASARAEAPPECNAFRWDMTRELALLAGAVVEVRAATQASSPPRIEVARGYAILLDAQAAVAFVQPPGGRQVVQDAHAGLLQFRVVTAGRYRISANEPAWIDVISNGQVLPSTASSGNSGCPLIHKSVEFELPAGADLVLQLSRSAAGRVRLVITPAKDATAPERQ